MANPIQILRAWSKVLCGFTDCEHERRARICSVCPNKRYSKFWDFVKGDELEEIKGFVCTDCGCPLESKIRSTDKCYKWETPTT